MTEAEFSLFEDMTFPADLDIGGYKHRRLEDVTDKDGSYTVIHPEFDGYTIFFPIAHGRARCLDAVKRVVAPMLMAEGVEDGAKQVEPAILDAWTVTNPKGISIDTPEIDRINIPLGPFAAGEWNWDDLEEGRLTAFLKKRTRRDPLPDDDEFARLLAADDTFVFDPTTEDKFLRGKIQRAPAISVSDWSFTGTHTVVEIDEVPCTYDRWRIDKGGRYLQVHSKKPHAHEIAVLYQLLGSLGVMRGDIKQRIAAQLPELS